MRLALIALLCGAVMTLGYAPFSFWPVIPLALISFFLLLTHSQRPAWLGFSFGLGWFSAGVGWVYVSIADYGGFPLPVSLLLMLLLAAYLALYPMLFASLLARFGPALWPLAAPVMWALCEFLRGHLLTGFPWLALGYSQIDSPLAGWLPVIGQAGISVLLIIGAAATAALLSKRRYVMAVTPFAILLLSGLAVQQVSWQTGTLSTPKITLVQGNIAQSIRWQPETEQPTMDKYLALTEPHWDSDIIIWPEAAIPRIEPLAQQFLVDLDKRAADEHSGLITGILNYNLDSREAFNGVIALGATTGDGPSYLYEHNNRYYKHHLLPIGEFVPFESWLRKLGGIFDLAWSSFQRGDYLQPDLIAKQYRLTTALCYEILFAEQVRDNLKSDTDFILTLSNDAWFGHSHGPHQHLEIARVRAAEFGIAVLRATNNGLTAMIDAQGKIIAKAPAFEATTLSQDVPVVRTDTPYRRFGDAPLWVLLGLAGIIALGLQRTIRRRPSH